MFIMTDEIRDILKSLIKVKEFGIKGYAKFRANKPETRDELIDLIEHCYREGHINEEQVIILVDFLDQEPVSITLPGTNPVDPSITPGTTPCPWTIPYNPPYTHPYDNRPWWAPDIVYCNKNNSNSISVKPGEGIICYTSNKA